MSDDTLSPRAPNWPLVTLAILAIVAAVVIARSFLMPVVLAFLLTLIFSPVRRFLQRRRVPPPLTATALLIALVVGIASLVFALSTPVQDYISDSRNIAAEVERKLRGISEAIEKVSETASEVEKMAEGDNGDASPAAASDEPQEVVVEGPSLLSRIVGGAPFVAAQIVFTLVLVFFLTSSGDMFYEKIVQAAPTFRDKKRSIAIVYDVERKLSRYFLTITVINAGLGVCVGLVLWWLGMPTPLLFGVMAFLLNFIPYLGALVGVAIATAIGIVTFDTVGQALLAGGLYFTLTSIEGNLVTPYAVGRSLKLNPVIVFLSVAFWGWAWSVIGMFIAVPTLITLRVFSEKVPALEGLGIFLAGHETPDEQKKSKEEREERAEKREAA